MGELICRATKTSPNLFNAFSSPCVPPLINLNVKISESLLLLPLASADWRARADALAAHEPSLPPRTSALPPRILPLAVNPTVLSCSIHPGITGTLLKAQIEAVPSCRAVILSAYGSGNLPINPSSGILDALRGAVEKEILVVVISQCACPLPPMPTAAPSEESLCRGGV